MAVVSAKNKKEDASSTTVASGIICITSDIDAHERRDVATMDIPGVLIHEDPDEYIIMALKINIPLLMCHVDPQLYRKYIIFDKRGKTVL